MSPDAWTVFAVSLGPTAALVAGIIGFLLKRNRAQRLLISRMRVFLVTTCMDKSEGIEKLAELVLSDGEGE